MYVWPLIILFALLTSACVEVLDPGERDKPEEPAIGEAEAIAGEFDDIVELSSDVEWILDQAARQAPVVDDDDPVDEEALVEDERFDDEEIEAQMLAEEDIDRDVRLRVDGDAPQLEIRQVQRREGSDAHYLDVACHDPEVNLGYRWVGNSRISDHCEVDLSMAVRAVSIEPTVSYRIAPTPQGFRIFGDFEQGDYEVRIAPGLWTEDGSVLHEEFSQTLEIPALSESLSFAAEGRYLPRSAWDQLTFRHRNVDEVKLQVRHVPPQNLPFWIADGGNRPDERTSNQVVDTRIAVPNEEDVMMSSSVEIDDYLQQAQPGLYQLTLSSENATANSRIQVTDLNLITKRHEADPNRPWEDHIDVWAVDMESAAQRSGVRVRALKPSGATMARCETNRDGHCRLALPEEDTDPNPPIAVIAQRGEDLTYLKFDEVRIESGVEAADGPAYREETNYLSTLYGDRDLYRPGDEFHLVGALRNDDFTVAEAGIPAEIRVRDPQGNTVLEETKETSKTGVFDLSYKLSDVAPTGRWRVSLEVGKRGIDTYTFNVEEFVPERLEVTAEPTKSIFVANEEPSFEVSARYLFGASAAGSEVDLECRLVPIESSIGAGSDYSYGPVEIDEQRSVVDLSPRSATIGEDDRVEVACPAPERTPSGPMRVEAVVSVAEGGSGRTTNASATAEMLPSPIQIGLRSSVDDLAPGDTFTIDGHFRDVDGAAVEEDGKVTLEFYNIRRHRSWQRDGWSGRYRVQYDYEMMLERVGDVQVKDGRFAVETTVADVHTAYLIRARYGDAKSDLKIDRRGRLWHWSGQTDHTPQARRPGQVTIDAPEEAVVGESTPIEFTAPFDGKALVTVETDEVVDQQWIDAEEGRNEWSFVVDGEEPNVYVGIFIIRDPREVSQHAFAPERAFGAVSVPVEATAVKTDVALDTPDEVRPGEVLRVNLEVADKEGPYTATVAAVDEGILQLTNYATPNPVTAMWTERSPGVETFDTIGWATQLPPYDPTSRTGGGAFYDDADAAGEAGRVMPFRPVALWSGPINVDADGRAFVEFAVPNYSGRLRVMTSVFGPRKMGGAEADVLVRDPITVQTTFPRHLAEADEPKIPVFVTNMTDQTESIEVSIEAEPKRQWATNFSPDTSGEQPLEFLDGTTREIELGPDQSTTVYFQARVASQGGAASVFVIAESDEHRSIDEGTIPLRPRGPTERTIDELALDDGRYDLADRLRGWVPTSEESTFMVSAFPEPQAFDNLEHLIRYPYGCAEQTISSTRPMVYLPDLVEGIDPRVGGEGDSIRERVDAGISRILSMQNSSGGFRFWPTSRSEARPWVSAYALHFLMDAADRGYAVPQSRINRAADWLSNQVQASSSSAYEHYVLAMAGQSNAGDIRDAIDDLPSTLSGRQRENAYLLKAALYLSGDRSFADDLRNPQVDSARDGRQSQWGFYSDRRRRAMKLGVFSELFGQHEDGEELVRAVTHDLVSSNGRRSLTTQEMIWGVAGLGNWYRAEGLEDVEVALYVNGQAVSTDNHASSHRTWWVNRASEFDDVSLQVERNGYEGNLSLMLRSQGVREEPTAQYGGRGLRVRRTLHDNSGTEIDADSIELGDVIYVRLRLENLRSNTQRHLAMEGRLPAGFEVENPDLGAAELPEWAQSDWEPDHVNVRDDRVEVFGEIARLDAATVVFPVRATLSGEYYLPSVDVEAMYDPEVWARSEGGRVRITDPRSELID